MAIALFIFFMMACTFLAAAIGCVVLARFLGRKYPDKTAPVVLLWIGGVVSGLLCIGCVVGMVGVYDAMVSIF